mgnify:CR=1 FL=1
MFNFWITAGGVPAVLKESGYGLGCTTWEVVRHIVIPYTRIGVLGGTGVALAGYGSGSPSTLAP